MGEWGSGIKSIQRGVIDFGDLDATKTATLSPAVDITKTELRHLGVKGQEGTPATLERIFCHLTLTNSTTVTATRILGGDDTYLSVSWETTEYY